MLILLKNIIRLLQKKQILLTKTQLNPLINDMIIGSIKLIYQK
jgi:hypothetical protein